MNAPRSNVDQVLALREKIYLHPRRVDFWWVKGHEGSFGNELADLLAKRARDDQWKYSVLLAREIRQRATVELLDNVSQPTVTVDIRPSQEALLLASWLRGSRPLAIDHIPMEDDERLWRTDTIGAGYPVARDCSTSLDAVCLNPVGKEYAPELDTQSQETACTSREGLRRRAEPELSVVPQTWFRGTSHGSKVTYAGVDDTEPGVNGEVDRYASELDTQSQ